MFSPSNKPICVWLAEISDMSLSSYTTGSSGLTDEFTPPNTPRLSRKVVSPSDITVDRVITPRYGGMMAGVEPRLMGPASSGGMPAYQTDDIPSYTLHAARKKPGAMLNYYVPGIGIAPEKSRSLAPNPGGYPESSRKGPLRRGSSLRRSRSKVEPHGHHTMMDPYDQMNYALPGGHTGNYYQPH